MRLDKYLKVSRLVKRRETAKELCEDGDIYIDGKVARASAEVKVGQKLTLILGERKIHAIIKDVKPFANKETASSMYEIVSE